MRRGSEATIVGRRPGAPRRGASATLLIASLLVALGCTSPGAPAWLQGGDADHPESEYLSAVGSGRSAETAHSNALGELSRVFHTRIDQVVTDDQTVHTQSDVHGRRSFGDRERVDVETRVETGGSFQGVEIARTWQDRETGLWYAMAVLDRSTEQRHVATKLRAKSELIAAHYARGLRAETSLERARWLGAALNESRLRDELVLRHVIVSRSPAPVSDVAPATHRLRDEVAEQIASTTFAVDAYDGATPVRSMISETLTNLGFSLAESRDGGTGDIAIVRGDLDLRRLDRGGKEWHFYAWRGSFEISVEGGSRVLLVSDFAGDTAHQTDRRARERARRLAGQAFEQEFAKQLGEFMAGADPERQALADGATR